MAAGVYNFKVEQGVAYSFSAFYKDKNNVAKDLTGYTAKGSIKLNMSDTTPVAEFTFTIVPLTGEVKVKLDHTALNGIVVKANKFDDYTTAVYDIYLYKTPEDPEPIRLLNGTIQISPKVT